MPSVLDPDDRARLLRRLDSLTEQSIRKWGQMTSAGMLLHLCQSARMALGDLPVKPRNRRAFQTFPLKHLLLYVVPFPKGAPTAPELRPIEPGELEVERASLRTLIERLGAGPRDGPGPVHPLFGPLSRREWGVLNYKHADHHFRQFGA
ncbi:MAG: DUF1569 domain-containing protein [Vicinamibacteria bacterium]